MNVLMIGNSFSFYNKLNYADGLLYQLAKSVGLDPTILPIYRGGHYLHEYLDPADPYGRQVDMLLNSDLHFDKMVLQEQSSYPIRNKEHFGECVAKLQAMTSAQAYLYATWGYHDDHPQAAEFGGTVAMEQKLRAACNEVGDKLHIPVANAGVAWTKVYTEHPEIDLYGDDRKHPSLAGSYLSACVLLGTVFGVTPTDAAYDAKLEPETAALLRSAAAAVL